MMIFSSFSRRLLAIRLVSVGLLLLAGVGLPAVARAAADAPPAVQNEIKLLGLTVQTTAGKTHSFKVEAASTLEDLQLGLMFRKSMAEDRGMIFLFPHPITAEMWMKNTYIPLDVLFIRADGTIAGIHANAHPLDETPFSAPEPVVAAVEINGGLAEKLGIAAGDRIVVPPYFP